MSGLAFGSHLWMIHVMDDIELLQEYARSGSEAAFTGLVERHAGLVYSAALRQANDASLAEEITQAVFILLARKAGTIRQGTILTGWLFRATRYIAYDAMRAQNSRRKREQQSVDMQMTANEEQDWEQIAPHLDEAVAKLSESDRNAVLLRYFENKTLAQVGVAMGTNQEAARKRVTRALEKLRSYFTKRGVMLSVDTISGLVAVKAVQAAPAAVIKSATVLALAQGATASTSTLTLIKGALKIMAWTKAKTAIVTGVVVLLAAGTTTVTVKTIAGHSDNESWRSQPNFDSRVLDRAAPQFKILPSKFSRGGGYGWNENKNVVKFMGLGVSVKELVEAAYMANDILTIFNAPIPPGRYDYIANLPSGNQQALKDAIKTKFGLVAHTEMIPTNVLFLEVKTYGAPGLVPSKGHYGGMTSGNGTLKSDGQGISVLLGALEQTYGKEVIDRTGLTGNYTIDLKWHGPDDLKQKLNDQLGLELVPTNTPVEMFVVDKVN